MVKELLISLGICLLVMFGLLSSAQSQPLPNPQFTGGQRVVTDTEAQTLKKQGEEFIPKLQNYQNLLRTAISSMDNMMTWMATAKAAPIEGFHHLQRNMDRIKKVHMFAQNRQGDMEVAYDLYVEGKNPQHMMFPDLQERFLVEYCNCISVVAQFQCKYLELQKNWKQFGQPVTPITP